ncbi:MAG: hypothetical protein ACKO0W_08735 [Planctomycetota bacterium]
MRKSPSDTGVSYGFAICTAMIAVGGLVESTKFSPPSSTPFGPVGSEVDGGTVGALPAAVICWFHSFSLKSLFGYTMPKKTSVMKGCFSRPR